MERTSEERSLSNTLDILNICGFVLVTVPGMTDETQLKYLKGPRMAAD